MATVPSLSAPSTQAGIVAPLAPASRYHAITLALSVWMILGVFVDAWSHGQNKPESFFSPWHAMLYSGYLATAAWMLAPALRSRRDGGLAWAGIPAGYVPGVVGIAMFALGGIGDAVWHTLFGFETGIEVLMSPPHFLLIVGIALIVGSPFRAVYAAVARDAEHPSLREFLLPLLSLIMMMSVVMMIFYPFWGFGSAHFITPGALARITREFAPTEKGLPLVLEVIRQRAIGNILVTNLLMLAPILIILRRWRPPFGTVTIFFFGTTVLLASMTGFFYLSILLVPLVAGLVADWVIAAWAPSPSRPLPLRTFATIVPAVLWSLYFLSTHLQWGVAWPPTLWLGVILWAAAGGLGLSLVAVPGPGGQTSAPESRSARPL